MVKIDKLSVLDNYKIQLVFSDHTEKTIDFKPFIGNDRFTSQLSSMDYFRKVNVYENGRGIYWPNEYDFCPDFLRNYDAK